MQEKNRNHRPQGAGQPPHPQRKSDGNKATKDNPLEKQSKHRRHQRHSKPHHRKSSDTDTRDNNTADSAEDKDNPLQPSFGQEDGQASPKKQATDKESEDETYMSLSEDEASLGDEEFIVPEDPVEQERFKCRLIATEKSLKKKQQ